MANPWPIVSKRIKHEFEYEYSCCFCSSYSRLIFSHSSAYVDIHSKNI